MTKRLKMALTFKPVKILANNDCFEQFLSKK